MTSALEYSYINDEFLLKISQELMTRAVRVKSAVREKIERIYNNSVVNTAVSVDEESKEVAPTPEVVESLFDFEEETLKALNDKLNALQIQGKVVSNTNRAVLFTKALVSKIEGVTARWFSVMPEVEDKSVASELHSIEVTNQLGGEVVPGTWDDVPENELTAAKEVELPPVVEPTLETVPTVDIEGQVKESESSTNELNAIGVANQFDSDVNTKEEVELPPAIEPTLEAVPAVEPSVNETPVVPEVVSSNEPEVPNFMPSIDELVPKVDSEETGEYVPQPLDFVPEPKVVLEEKSDFVPEPVVLVGNESEIGISSDSEETNNLPSFEENTPEIGKVNTLENSTDSSDVSDKDETKSMTIEDKIANLIQRRNANYANKTDSTEVTTVSEETPSEEEDKSIRTDMPELTQAHVLARLRRINNTMSEKDSTIKGLTAKNEALKEEVVAGKEKIKGYEAVVSDLTARNSDLASQNERLSSRVAEVESASNATIAKLEAKIAELTQSRTDENESSKKALTELKEKYASEMAEIKEKHAIELRQVSESKEKQIQAIYATISEALGEPVSGDDYGYTKAA